MREDFFLSLFLLFRPRSLFSIFIFSPLFHSVACLFHFVRRKRDTMKVNSRLKSHVSNEQLLILFIDPRNRKRDLVVKSHVQFKSHYAATTPTNSKIRETEQIEAIYQQEIISQIHIHYVARNLALAMILRMSRTSSTAPRFVSSHFVVSDTMIRERYLR